MDHSESISIGNQTNNSLARKKRRGCDIRIILEKGIRYRNSEIGGIYYLMNLFILYNIDILEGKKKIIYYF